MHILIAILGLVMAAGVWAWRIRMARDAMTEVSGLAGDVVSAARRLGFRRKTNVHPVESVDEPALAITGVALAFVDLASLPTAEQLANLKAALQRQLAVTEVKADEMLIVSRWLVNECKGADSAVTRLTKRLQKLDPTGFQPLLAMLGDVESHAALGPRQRDALDDIARIFRLT